ncbi:MAG: hypothetical protein WC052_02625 [Patescibacteria group bacterium]
MFSFFQSFHSRVSRLDFWDIKLVGTAGLLVGFLLGRFWPALLDVSPWWWLTLFLLVVARPTYHYWIESSQS